MLTADMLADRVRSTFPEVTFLRAELEERGGDHRVLILDSGYAFRFPRRYYQRARLGSEIATLAVLERCSPLALPRYRFVDPAGEFAGYPFIAGSELTTERFARLGPPARARIMAELGRFLRVLHGLAPDAQMLATGCDTAALVAEARATTLPIVADYRPQLGERLAAFYAAYPVARDCPACVLHGDLVDDHILLAPDQTRLAGIIDFGDVRIGDPAEDLMFMWSYGEAAMAQLLDAYRRDGGDPELADRSCWAHVRFRADRLAAALRDRDKGDDVDAAADALGRLLEMILA